MTGPLPKILFGNRYCIGVVDEYIYYSWSFFTQNKSQLPKNVAVFFEKMTQQGTPVKFLRCDNARENQ